jgi:hypothetical protein
MILVNRIAQPAVQGCGYELRCIRGCIAPWIGGGNDLSLPVGKLYPPRSIRQAQQSQIGIGTRQPRRRKGSGHLGILCDQVGQRPVALQLPA